MNLKLTPISTLMRRLSLVLGMPSLLCPIEYQTDLSNSPGDDCSDMYLIYSERIYIPGFKVIFAFSALTLTFSALKFVFRLEPRYMTRIDDTFEFIGLLCLISSIGVLYHHFGIIFRIQASNMDPNVLITLSEALDLMLANKWTDITLALMWVTTFAIKTSVLAYVRNLVRDISRRLGKYHWFAVSYIAVTWLFIMVEPVVLCQNLEIATGKYISGTEWTMDIYVTSIAIVLEVGTEIMMGLIPVIVLETSDLKPSVKIGLEVILFISPVMIIINLVLITGSIHSNIQSNGERISRQLFWQYMEGNIAILIGIRAAFHGIITDQQPRDTATDANSYQTVQRNEY
ncbi:hypothetical protein BS50DRAFT_620260 [Corynespora cassiicola Philippines]|uniref:Integral membrane protein n=1 Tax=Corynespora cassiicola Philippines TaxID=1448308 RepID=A0A2T2NQR1_CORCC|nr:hypothetical protein BS50DRAFT_620260 [Corynespora cassiicola Philippines]